MVEGLDKYIPLTEVNLEKMNLSWVKEIASRTKLLAEWIFPELTNTTHFPCYYKTILIKQKVIIN